MSTTTAEVTPEGTENPPAGGAPDPKPEKTFTQAEVTAIAAREKDEGRRAAEAAVAKELGVPLDEAKNILKAARDAEEARKSEADKARELAEKEREEAKTERETAKQEVFETRLERAFLKEGLELDDEAKLGRVRRMVTVGVEASYEDVLKDVQQIKADFPALFGTGTPEPKKKAPSGDPQGTPPKPTGGEDKFSAGMERAKNYGKPPQ